MIDEMTKDALNRYVHDKIETGSFLRAVLENDLFSAAGRADHINRYRLFEICSYIYNELPAGCFGSPEKVKRWLESK